VAFIGDQRRNIYALDANTGALIWKSHVDDHPLPALPPRRRYHDGRRSLSASRPVKRLPAPSRMQCCTFRAVSWP
jgi:polyvinyl alcohol dehydrogenase (cytochrome)